MKIVTWNIERLKKGTKILADKILQHDADIIVLTETGPELNLQDRYYGVHTELLSNMHDGYNYHNENRCSIWAKKKIINSKDTYDCFTSVCADVDISNQPLTIYGTIIGIAGGKGERFIKDMNSTINDLRNLKFENLCFSGDFNTMLSGYAYPSHEARNKLNNLFDELSLTCLTSALSENVNHIVLSNSMIQNRSIFIETWNEDKRLSDHTGICITIK